MDGSFIRKLYDYMTDYSKFHDELNISLWENLFAQGVVFRALTLALNQEMLLGYCLKGLEKGFTRMTLTNLLQGKVLSQQHLCHQSSGNY